MLREDDLVHILSIKKDRRLICLAILNGLGQPAKTAAIRDRGYELGRREMRDWNLSDILRKAAGSGLVAQLPDGWKLLPSGSRLLKEAGVVGEAPIILAARHQLHKQLSNVADPHRREFLEEALGCFDNGNYRAAVVLCWVGAASIIQDHVIQKHLTKFNAVGATRFPKFKAVNTIKDISSILESDLLQLCQDCGMLDKAEKQELQARLDLRNRCGHPNSFKLAEHTVASHIEILTLNVYARY